MAYLLVIADCKAKIICPNGDELGFTTLEDFTEKYANFQTGRSNKRLASDAVANWNYDALCEYYETCVQGNTTQVEVRPAPPSQTLVPKNFELKDGVTITLQDIVTAESAIGVSSFDFDLKPVGGETMDGFTSTTAQAMSTGPIGNRDLDPGGSFSEDTIQYSDGSFRELPLTQTFVVSNGSIAELNVELIF